MATSYIDLPGRINIVGDMSVGKTSIISRLMNQGFDENIMPTMGVDFVSVSTTIDNLNTTCQVVCVTHILV